MFCSKCGSKIKENAKFCVKCGEPVKNINKPEKTDRPKQVKEVKEDKKENKAAIITISIIIGLLIVGIIVTLAFNILGSGDSKTLAARDSNSRKKISDEAKEDRKSVV